MIDYDGKKYLHLTPDIENAVDKMISITMGFMAHNVSEEEFKHYKKQLYSIIDNTVQAEGVSKIYN